MRKSILLLIGASLIVTVGLVIKFYQGSRPAVGTIYQPKPAEIVKPKPPSSPTLLTGRSFELSYPSDYRPHDIIKPNPTILEQYSFITPSQPAIKSSGFNVIIRNLPSNGVSEDSAYKLRSEINRQDYSQKQVIVNGHPVYLFTKTNDGIEQTAFVVSKDKFAIIALTAPANLDEVQTNMTEILTSFKWH